MPTFSIEQVETHDEALDSGQLVHWAAIKLIVHKDFDWTKDGTKLLKKLEAAASLIGRGDP